MKVKDLIAVTHDYQDYSLIIKEFGTGKILYRMWFPNDYDENKLNHKYADKEIAAVQFYEERLCITLAQGENNG